MNSSRLFITGLTLIILSAGSLFAQAVGDYGSKASGNWGTDGTNWIVCTSPGTWTGATDPAPSAPSQTTNVWIRSGHSVMVNANKNSLNLTVELGASLVGDLSHPTGTIQYLRVYGATVTINGVFGASTAPGTNLALEASTSSITLTIGGSGTFGPSRVRANVAASGTTIVFDMNTTFYNTGSGGTGGIALYPQTDSNIFTINAGKTLTFVKYASMGVGAANGTVAATGLVINLHGTIDLSQDSSSLTLKAPNGKTATLNVFPGASLTVGGDVYASTVEDSGTTIMTVNGSMTAGGAIDFSGPSFVVTGTGSFTVPDSSNLIIGHPAGITSSGATGQIQTTTRSFSTGAAYTYAGTDPQVTGSGLPSLVRSLILNNDTGTTMTGPVTVNDSLMLTGGNLITGPHTVTIGPSGIVTRDSGHVVGKLQKNVAAGSVVLRSFEVGTSDRYAPVEVMFASVSTPGNLSASTTAGDHPNLATSGIDPAKSVNRYWTLLNSGIVFTTYDATFNFVAADIDAGAHPGVFTAERYTGSWSGLTEGTRTSTSTQITGAASFSDFAIGEAIGAPLAPAFELTSSSLNFGSVTVGNSSIDSIYVRNIGTATLNISSIVSTNTPVFSVVPSNATIVVGDSVKVTVTFAPSSFGSTSASIVFVHDGASSPDTLSVSGTGTSAGAILSNGTGGGHWASDSTWQGGNVPTGIDSVVILATDSVYVLADTSCRGLRIQSGGKLGLGDTLSVDFATVFGSLVARPDGRLVVSDTASFGNGSIYRHDRDGGSMPTRARWDIGSTCLITGLTGNAPANSNQNYHDVVWNCPSQTGNLNLAWSGNTISGNVTCISSASSRFQMTNNLAHLAPITIMGDVIMTGGALTPTGSGGAANYTINTYGNIVVTGGNLGISRGSGGVVTWNLYGDFSVANATLQASNNNCAYTFAKSGAQNVTFTNVTLGGGAMNYTVNSTSTLNVGTSILAGSGSFILNGGATLESGHANGVNGNIATTGVNGGGNSFSTTANYTFNGAVSQVTGTLLPDILNNLTISNNSGVACSDSFQVNGTLAVTSGDLNLNGKIITLGASGLLSETSGNTVTGTSGLITTTRTLSSPSIANDIAGLGIMIGSTANPGSTVLSRGHAVQSVGGGGIRRYVNITPTTNTGLNATLKLRYDESEIVLGSESSLQLHTSTNGGSTWTLAGGTVNTVGNTIEVAGLDGLFRWTAATNPIVSTAVNASWNLISNPVSTLNDSVKQLYQSATFDYAFAFNPGAGYGQSYRLLNGLGYWEKFPADTSYIFGGTPIVDTLVNVQTGWNLVGSISIPVDTTHITFTPPTIKINKTFYAYAGSYSAVSVLTPGKGFWIKTSGAGTMRFWGGSSPASKVVPSAEESALTGLNSITIRDAAGMTQTLYFGADEAGTIDLSLHEMPPLPPVGAFDARFESAEGGRSLQTHAARNNNVIELPIVIQSTAYPLTVSWNVIEGAYVLTDGSSLSRSMEPGGSMMIENSGVKRIVLASTGISEIPAEYGLDQNYPNPFNPVTNIKFALPVESYVTLDVYNAIGQRVQTLVNENHKAGYHLVQWNGTGSAGQALASGVYFLQLSAQGTNGKSFNEMRKLLLLK